MIPIVSLAYTSQVYRDVGAYVRLLEVDGGIISSQEVFELRAFTKALCARFGKTDFFTFRKSQNVGTGSMARSFYGRTATLINGPVWSDEGIVLPVANAQINVGGYLKPMNDGNWSWVAILKGVDMFMYTAASPSWPNFPMIWASFWGNGTRFYAGYQTATTPYWGETDVPAGVNRNAWNSYYLSMEPTWGANGMNGAITKTINSAKGAANFDGSIYTDRFQIASVAAPENSVAFFVRLPVASHTPDNFFYVHNLYKNTIGKGLSLL